MKIKYADFVKASIKKNNFNKLLCAYDFGAEYPDREKQRLTLLEIIAGLPFQEKDGNSKKVRVTKGIRWREQALGTEKLTRRIAGSIAYTVIRDVAISNPLEILQSDMQKFLPQADRDFLSSRERVSLIWIDEFLHKVSKYEPLKEEKWLKGFAEKIVYCGSEAFRNEVTKNVEGRLRRFTEERERAFAAYGNSCGYKPQGSFRTR